MSKRFEKISSYCFKLYRFNVMLINKFQTILNKDKQKKIEKIL